MTEAQLTEARRRFLGEFPLVYKVEDLELTKAPPHLIKDEKGLIAYVDITAKKVAFRLGEGVSIQYRIDKTEMLPGRGFKAFVQLPNGTQFTFVGIRIHEEEVATLPVP